MLSNSLVAKWSWDSLDRFYIGNKQRDSGSDAAGQSVQAAAAEDMELFHIIHRNLGAFTFECDDASIVLEVFENMKTAVEQRRKQLQEQISQLSEAQAARIKATFLVMDTDKSGQMSRPELSLLFKLLGFEKRCEHMMNQMDKDHVAEEECGEIIP